MQRAFSLGWHVAELYHFDKLSHGSERSMAPPEPTPPQNPPPTAEPSATPVLSGHRRGQNPQATDVTVKAPLASLPGIGSLSGSDRRAILVRQIRHDLTQVWLSAPDSPDVGTLDARIVAAQRVADVAEFRRKILALHKTLLSGLTVADFRLGKSYGLGRALAESTILPCAAAASGQDLARDHAQGALGAAFKDSLGEELNSGRVSQVQAWLHDLRDCFPTYAADAVATTLAGWAVWLVRPTVGDRQFVDWNNGQTRGRIERTLRRQGDVWRGLLSGEKDPVNMLTSDYYFAAIRSMLSRVAQLALRFLGTGVGFFLFLIVLVTGIALYFSSIARNGTGALAAVITFLGSLGITTGSAWAAVQKALSKAEEPLWNAELAAAVAQATWHNPAPLGSIAEIQLLLTIGSTPDVESETRARHPRLTALRNLPVGRVGIALIVASTAVGLFGAGAGWLQRDAAFFLPPLCIIAFLAAIDGWDLLIGLASRQRAPYLALPERIQLPDWAAPLAEVLAPVLLVAGLLAGHYFWH